MFMTRCGCAGELCSKTNPSIPEAGRYAGEGGFAIIAVELQTRGDKATGCHTVLRRNSLHW